MKYLDSLNVTDKRVLVRTDLNLPFDEQRKIADDSRIKLALPTIKAILEKGGRPILMAHNGESDPSREKDLSLRPVAQRLAELLSCEVLFATNCIGEDAEAQSRELKPGQVLLLENLRFNAGEQENDPTFCAALARLGDVYVNDALGSSHKKYASTFGVAQLFKERAAGFNLQREQSLFARGFEKPKRPICLVLGGSRLSTRLPVLSALLKDAEKIILGGAMATTFLAAQGLQMGRSRYESDLFPKVFELIGSMARRECKVYLPVDFLVAPSPTAQGLARAVPAQEVPADTMVLDIGPATSLLFKEALQSAETIIWNGPMGSFELEEYSKGTTDLIESIASCHAYKLVGGRDTYFAIQKMQLAHKFEYLSTGGGSFLGMLSGEKLPGLELL